MAVSVLVAVLVVLGMFHGPQDKLASRILSGTIGARTEVERASFWRLGRLHAKEVRVYGGRADSGRTGPVVRITGLQARYRLLAVLGLGGAGAHYLDLLGVESLHVDAQAYPDGRPLPAHQSIKKIVIGPDLFHPQQPNGLPRRKRSLVLRWVDSFRPLRPCDRVLSCRNSASGTYEGANISTRLQQNRHARTRGKRRADTF